MPNQLGGGKINFKMENLSKIVRCGRLKIENVIWRLIFLVLSFLILWYNINIL